MHTSSHTPTPTHTYADVFPFTPPRPRADTLRDFGMDTIRISEALTQISPIEQAKLDSALLELKELDVAVCMAVSKVA